MERDSVRIKMVAVLAIVITVSTAMVMMSGESESDSSDGVTYLVISDLDTSGTTKQIDNNQGQYTGYDYELQISMAVVWISASIGPDNDWTPVYKVKGVYRSGTQPTENVDPDLDGRYVQQDRGFQVTVTNDAATPGRYYLTFKATGDEVNRTRLAVSVNMTSYQGGVEYDGGTHYYCIDINSNTSPIAMTLRDMALDSGINRKSMEAQAQIPEDVAGFEWFASNLPEGISMSPDGYIEGRYTEKSGGAQGKVAQIKAYGPTGKEYTGTMKITWTDYGPGGLAIEITAADGGKIQNDGSKIVKTGTDQTMKIQVLKYGAESEISSCRVATIQSDAAGAGISDATAVEGVVGQYTFTLPTSGTGCYVVRVVATDSSGYQASSMFYVYVVAQMGDVVAYIDPSSSGGVDSA